MARDSDPPKYPEAAPAPPPGKPVGAALIAILGPIAAAALFMAVPKEESGRTVSATVAPDGKSIVVRNVSGRQYLAAYLDDVGVATACDGITHRVKLGQRYTEEQCAALLEGELVAVAYQIMACTPALRAPGRDYQRVAVVLLAYNIGWPRYCKSTVDRRFDAGDIAGACDAFLMWDKAGGRPILRPRRERERSLWCLRGVVRNKPIVAQADYQRCIRIDPGPLRPTPRLEGDNRQREIA